MVQMKQNGRFPVFRYRLYSLMEDEFLSITEFAEKLGLSRQTVGFYLSGDRIPDALTLRQICERCSVSADWLLGLTDKPTPDSSIRAVCEYTGLSIDAAEILHATKSNGFMPQLVDAVLCAIGADTKIQEAITDSAQAMIVDSKNGVLLEIQREINNRIATISRNSKNEYCISATDAADLYLNSAITSATAGIASAILAIRNTEVEKLKNKPSTKMQVSQGLVQIASVSEDENPTE